MEIKYNITYHKQSKKWVVWKNIESERGINCMGIFRGTRKECELKLKELKNGQRGV